MTKKVLLVGLGKSNRALYKYFRRKKVEVYTYDDTVESDYDFLRLQKEKPIFDIAYISPGIYPNSNLYSLIAKSALEVSGELSLALEKVKKKIHVIGITGTNGKTSTVKMLEGFLSFLGAKVLVAGNIGFPLIEYLSSVDKYDYLIVEVSSYQAAMIKEKVFDDLIITSYAPNHLDAYNDESEYLLSKKRLLLCTDNLIVGSETARSMNIDSADSEIDTSKFYGSDKDYLLVCEMLKELGFLEEQYSGLDYHRFLPVSRYELFFQKGQVCFIDDSKSTSLEAVANALHMAGERTTLILGGHLKSDFPQILSAADIMIYGEESAEFLKHTMGGSIYQNLEDLVDKLEIDFTVPRRILFSPGGSSLQYPNFMIRGAEFKRLIRKKYGSQD